MMRSLIGLMLLAGCSVPHAGLTHATSIVPSENAAAPEPTTVATTLRDTDPRESSAALAPGEWHFLLSPYLWAVGLDGDAEVAGQKVPLDFSFSDILDDFSGGGSLFFEARRGPWGFAVDGTYVTLESSDTNGATTVATDTGIGLLGVDGFYQIDRRNQCDLLVGARVLDIDSDISVTGFPAVNGGITSTQAVFGARARWDVRNRWKFNLRGDIGLGSSDISWQALALAGYQFGQHWGVDIGYRVMGIDVSDGGAKLDATLHGLMLGVVFDW